MPEDGKILPVLDTMDTAGMAEPLYNKLKYRLDFVRNHRRTERNSESNFQKLHQGLHKSRAEKPDNPIQSHVGYDS
jgi:hypothetical protein